MGKDYSNGEIVILWVLQATQATLSLISWDTRISVYFHAWVLGHEHGMCANSGIMSLLFSWKNGKQKFF